MSADQPTAPRRSAMQRAWDGLRLAFWRVAASGWVPARWFNRALPPEAARAARSGRLQVEVVSHCWRYAHLLAYQLSSLVHFPPRDVEIMMTVFYAEEDAATVRLLAFFGAIPVPRVRWHWQALPKEQLFRRAIGRNRAALATRADWVWFTDCDLMFRAGCLDALGAALQGRRDALVYPRVERVTDLLTEDDPRLRQDTPALVDIDDTHFTAREPGRATGPLQITHGDVARALGYCAPIAYYQQPATAWCKAHEDRAHRWLLESQGTPLDIPGVYRIRHVFKGRYAEGSAVSRVRSGLRQRQDARRDEGAGGVGSGG
jgi:hypothetical protein